MPAIDPAHEDLTSEAWRQIRELITTGTTTRQNGSRVELKPEVYAHLLRWLADKKAVARRNVPRPEDFSIAVTGE